jgi:hypothetical protein
MVKTAMIKSKNDVPPLQTSGNFDFAEPALVINKHFEKKLQALEAGLKKLSTGWEFETFTVTVSGKLNPDNPNPLAEISINWPESLEPEVNKQIQLLKDNFFSKS